MGITLHDMYEHGYLFKPKLHIEMARSSRGWATVSCQVINQVQGGGGGDILLGKINPLRTEFYKYLGQQFF